MPGYARPIFRFICLLTQTWPWAHCCVVCPASPNWKDLDTDSWFEAAAPSSAAPHMTIPSKMNLADAYVRLHRLECRVLRLLFRQRH